MWEWLNLLLFPLVLFLLPGWARQVSELSARAGAYAMATALLFVIVIIGGYGWGWEWTGFVGSFRDWLGLLIAPFVVPAVFAWIYTRRRMREPLAAVPATASSTPPAG
ncbi:MAG TPA: hypothetical protein VIG86_12220 [Candidatus Dormibacteraeota bacterium]|jgi:fatty acid desaturase